MLFKRKTKPHAISSIIGEDLVIQGDVIFQGGLQVNGSIRGNVSTPDGEDSARSQLSLHREGSICGNVSAPFLVLDGKVEGNVSCQKFLVIERNCHITGDVHYQSMHMVPGAVVTGRIRHVPEGLMLEHKEGNQQQRPNNKMAPKAGVGGGEGG